MFDSKKIAILIPAYNEEVAIYKVVTDFASVLPKAQIYVFDNNSVDKTALKATEAGAIVRSVRLQGKGNVVRSMFSDVEADVYVLVDGDATYDPKSILEMIDCLFEQNLDMVVGRRIAVSDDSYRGAHQFGNYFLSQCVSYLFGRHFTDILSGYRVFSRRYVKSFPAFSSGFEIESELTVHALELRMPVLEIDTSYSPRLQGSYSKLNTYKDGWLIFKTIFNLYRNEEPLMFYGLIGALMLITAFLIAIPIFTTYFQTGLVPRMPTFVLVTAMSITGFLMLICGLILDTVTRGRQELKRLIYLQIKAPSH